MAYGTKPTVAGLNSSYTAAGAGQTYWLDAAIAALLLEQEITPSTNMQLANQVPAGNTGEVLTGGFWAAPLWQTVTGIDKGMAADPSDGDYQYVQWGDILNATTDLSFEMLLRCDGDLADFLTEYHGTVGLVSKFNGTRGYTFTLEKGYGEGDIPLRYLALNVYGGAGHWRSIGKVVDWSANQVIRLGFDYTAATGALRILIDGVAVTPDAVYTGSIGTWDVGSYTPGNTSNLEWMDQRYGTNGVPFTVLAFGGWARLRDDEEWALAEADYWLPYGEGAPAPELPEGHLWRKSSTGVLHRCDGTEYVRVDGSRTRQVSVPLGDGSGVIPTGDAMLPVRLPFAGEIVSWSLLADQAGDLAVDVQRDTLANYPPGSGDSIVGLAGPGLAAAAAAEDDTGDWDDATFAAGDVLRFEVTDADTVTWAVLGLVLREREVAV